MVHLAFLGVPILIYEYIIKFGGNIMSFPVFRGAGYVLVHTPDMIIKNGTTCTVEQ